MIQGVIKMTQGIGELDVGEMSNYGLFSNASPTVSHPFQYKFNMNLLSVVMVFVFQHFTGRLPVLHKETRRSDNINLGFITGQRTTWT